MDRLASKFADLMLNYFADRKIEGLRLHDSIRQTPAQKIISFFKSLNAADRQDAPPAWLEQTIEAGNLSWVEYIRVSQVPVAGRQPLSPPGDTPPSSPPSGGQTADSVTTATPPGDAGARGGNGADKARKNKRKSAIQTYGNAVLALQDIARKISGDRQASIKKTVRLVQNMVDMVVDDNQMFISLSTIRDYDDYTSTHSINVAILSICLGHKVGIAKSSLETLSLGALFHDLGKIDVPREILNKPGRLTEQEMVVMKKHAIDSVRRIIKLKTTRSNRARLMLPPFEHHLKFDLSGYPQTPRKKPLSLFGRIICIADVFDALTAPRVYRPSAWSPGRALGYMLERAGQDFDPILLNVFVNMIGIYPIGTLLRLQNQQLGLVARYAEENDGNRELGVQLLCAQDDGSFRKGDMIRISSWNASLSPGDPKIIESMHPSVFGIQPAEFIM